MTEHVHEWECADGNFYAYQCSVCGDKVTRGWALSRVNACERLSAEAATSIYEWICGYEIRHHSLDSLRAYADMLEGK